MDENKLQVEDEFEGGSMFASNKILIAMVVIALIAVLIGMGGQRSAQDKSPDFSYAAEAAADRADRIAGFDDETAGQRYLHHPRCRFRFDTPPAALLDHPSSRP